MTAKKAAAKKPAKKVADEQPEADDSQTVVQDAPEADGEEYHVGYLGVSQDDADYSMSAEVARLSEG